MAYEFRGCGQLLNGYGKMYWLNSQHHNMLQGTPLYYMVYRIYNGILSVLSPFKNLVNKIECAKFENNNSVANM